MGNDVKIGSMWFRADDFDAKVNVLTADDDVIRYEYLKRNDDGSLVLGRASHEHFLETFIEWDDDYERFRPGSIWEAVRGCGQAAKGKQIKILGLMGDLVEWTFLDNFEKDSDHCTCKSSFLYCFTRIADNDNGAVYRTINPPIGMVKVKNTKPAFSISPITIHVLSSVEYAEIKPQEDCKAFITNGKDFHFNHELFSMNPAKEFCVDANDPNHSRKLIDPNKGESKMEDNGTYLKTDKNKLEDFGTGAKREDKSGKGRYDLIPGDVMQDFEDYVEKAFTGCEGVIKSPTEVDVSSSAYFNDWQDENNYYKFIVNVTAWNFVRIPIDKDEMTYVEFRKGFYEMRKELARHYEEGAKVHGVDNWKKGLPIYGSERGGCFLDSMRRHTDQMLQRKTDEPHAVAALWNAFCALWTLKHKPYSTTYQNASAVKAEEKPKSAHFDMVDSAINALKYMNKDKDHLSATKVITPSGKKFTIRKWPEGYEPVVDFEKEALMREMNLNYSSYNDIIDGIREVNLMNLEKRIESYHDTKYNLENVVEILRKIINSKNFNRRADRVRQVYFDIYTALVILNDIIVWFHEYPDDMNHIKTIVSDVQCMINQNVGRIHECCGHITLIWASCPKCKYGYVVCLGEPNEDKLNILYETIGRAVRGLLNRDEKGLDPFCGLGITQSLAKFNTDCIMKRIHNK
jgi:hypothetical protein